MGEAAQAREERVGDEPAAVLGAVLAAVRRTGTDVLAVVRPVTGPDGVPQDLDVVADSGLLTRLCGRPAVGLRVGEELPTDVAGLLVDAAARAWRSGEVVRGDVALTADGRGVLGPGSDGDPADARVGEAVVVPIGGYLVLLGREVTEARADRRGLVASEQRYRRLVEHSSDPIVVVTAGGTITYASPAVRAVVDREPEELLGGPFRALVHPQDAGACARLLADVVAAPAGASRTAQLRTLDATGAVGWVTVTATNWVDDATVAGVVVNVRDVTEQRAAEARLQREALQDSLTGLGNRRWFLRALEEAVSRSSRTAAPFAVLMIDVDDFKRVNDSRGHAAGDALLAELARRLGGALRPSDTAARLGGDEFVVIAGDLHSADDAVTVARRVLDRCSGPYPVGGGDPVDVTVSVGLATSHEGDDVAGGAGGGQVTGAGLLRRADDALYRAKRRGRHRIEHADR